MPYGYSETSRPTTFRRLVFPNEFSDNQTAFDLEIPHFHCGAASNDPINAKVINREQDATNSDLIIHYEDASRCLDD